MLISCCRRGNYIKAMTGIFTRKICYHKSIFYPKDLTMNNSLQNYIASLNDPIAEKVKWNMKKMTQKEFLRMPNKETHLIIDRYNPKKIIIKPALKNMILNEGLYLAVLTYILVNYFSSLFYYLVTISDQTNSFFLRSYYITIILILIIGYFIGFMLVRVIKIFTDPAYFDIKNKKFISGSKQIDFSDIHAVQIVSGILIKNKTQIYLILHDASRLPICIENNVQRSQNIASEIARFTNVQLWDATDYI